MVELDEKFIESVSENYPINKDKIIDAYKFANEKHDGVLRKSGEPYIVHPVAIAQILIDNNMDYSTIMAGLLHDVVEDTEVTLRDIENRFGKTVAKLVDGVTKIDEIKLKTKDLNEAESIKHLLIAMGNDIRVIFIKLADRLHNMRTIEFLKREKQIRMATETQELFIPIAERIGVRKIRTELQSLTFKCLHPEEYIRLKTEIMRKLTKRKDQVDAIETNLKNSLKESGIEATVVGWPEHTYSLYKKIMSPGIDKLFCLMLFKVIVPTEEDCYKALGLFHKMFEPVPGQIRDHIASPKRNGYRSIHSVMISDDADITFKVMIRTDEMDKTAEYGISSYWQDKDSDTKFDEDFEKLNKLKDVVMGENNNLNSTSSFIDAIKTDLAPDSTWLLTPKLKPICVNVLNPTAIDFAYAVHTKIGNNATAAILNGKKTTLGTILKAGDVVEIVTSEENKAPSRNWLQVVKSTLARRKIREYINKHTTPKYIEKGIQSLTKELLKINHKLQDIENVFPQLKEEFNFVSLDDMFASIGYRSVTLNQITRYVIQDDIAKEIEKTSPVDVPLEKYASLAFAKCCCPLYGDDIVGVVSKNGVTIHTANCLNLKGLGNDKVVDATWREGVDRLFDVNLRIVAKDTIGLAAKIFKMIADEKFDMSRISAREINSTEAEFEICVGVKNNKELDRLLTKLRTFDAIKTVNRFFDK